MKITFSLLKAPAKAALQQGQKSFDEQGGTIGRGDGNTWVLPDPDKFLSSKHCAVTWEQGQFYITDTSTNGLFLNGASLPVGRNNRVSVSEGDTLDLGEYRLRVGLEKSAAKISPFADVAPPEPAPIANPGAQWGAIEQTPQTDGAELFPVGGGAGGDPFYDPSMDPFAAKDPFGLGGQKPADPFANMAGAPQDNPFGADPFGGGDMFGGPDPFAPPKSQPVANFTQQEGRNPLHDAVSLPKIAANPPGPAAIPDDFWNSLGGAGAAEELGMPSFRPVDPFTSPDPLAGDDPFGSGSPAGNAPLPIKPQPPANLNPVSPPPAQPVGPKPTVIPPLVPPSFREEPPAPAPGPDALGENPFAHLGQSGTGPLPIDADEGQVYPLGSAFSTHVPTHTPGKVPLSDRLKAMQGPEAQDTSSSWASQGEAPAPVPVAPVQVPPPVPTQAPSPAPQQMPAQGAHFGSVPPVAPPSSPAAQRAPEHDTGVQNLIAALGLSGQLTYEQEQVLPQLIGEMTRESLNGMLQILRARNSIKNEFRIAVTTIQPRENNPIKFATDVDDALELLFVRSSKGFKPPVESVQDSFESIMDHQVAILAGIRAAFKSLLSRFDPLQLEQQFERLGKTGGILPGMKGAKCWTAYDDFYQDLIGNFENSFQNLFGDEFVQAYEEQLRKLSIARKREHSQR